MFLQNVNVMRQAVQMETFAIRQQDFVLVNLDGMVKIAKVRSINQINIKDIKYCFYMTIIEHNFMNIRTQKYEHVSPKA